MTVKNIDFLVLVLFMCLPSIAMDIEIKQEKIGQTRKNSPPNIAKIEEILKPKRNGGNAINGKGGTQNCLDCAVSFFNWIYRGTDLPAPVEAKKLRTNMRYGQMSLQNNKKYFDGDVEFETGWPHEVRKNHIFEMILEEDREKIASDSRTIEFLEEDGAHENDELQFFMTFGKKGKASPVFHAAIFDGEYKLENDKKYKFLSEYISSIPLTNVGIIYLIDSETTSLGHFANFYRSDDKTYIVDPQLGTIDEISEYIRNNKGYFFKYVYVWSNPELFPLSQLKNVKDERTTLKIKLNSAPKISQATPNLEPPRTTILRLKKNSNSATTTTQAEDSISRTNMDIDNPNAFENISFPEENIARKESTKIIIRLNKKSVSQDTNAEERESVNNIDDDLLGEDFDSANDDEDFFDDNWNEEQDDVDLFQESPPALSPIIAAEKRIDNLPSIRKRQQEVADANWKKAVKKAKSTPANEKIHKRQREVNIDTGRKNKRRAMDQRRNYKATHHSEDKIKEVAKMVKTGKGREEILKELAMKPKKLSDYLSLAKRQKLITAENIEHWNLSLYTEFAAAVKAKYTREELFQTFELNDDKFDDYVAHNYEKGKLSRADTAYLMKKKGITKSKIIKFLSEESGAEPPRITDTLKKLVENYNKPLPEKEKIAYETFRDHYKGMVDSHDPRLTLDLREFYKSCKSRRTNSGHKIVNSVSERTNFGLYKKNKKTIIKPLEERLLSEGHEIYDDNNIADHAAAYEDDNEDAAILDSDDT